MKFTVIVAGCLLGIWCAAAQADADLVGLAQGRAVFQFGAGGKTRVLRDGESAEGVKLIRATAESAVVEVDGQRKTIALGSDRLSGGGSGKAARVTLAADGQGHFFSTGYINGASVRFLVDTGASLVSMSVADAKKLGINYLAGEKGMSMTANGVARAYRVKLESVTVGDVRLNNVDASVGEANMPFVLLGMSFLSRMEIHQEGTDLTLTKRF